MSHPMRYHYRFDRNQDQTLSVSEVIMTDNGWMESKDKEGKPLIKVMTEDEAQSFRHLLKERGYVVSYPPSYGRGNVVEYWDMPLKNGGQ